VRKNSLGKNKEMKFNRFGLHHLTVDLAAGKLLRIEAKSGTWSRRSNVGRSTRPVWKIDLSIYTAGPSRGVSSDAIGRVYIEKEDGRKRPLGVAQVGDKTVQQAVTILNQIYEEDLSRLLVRISPGA